MSGCPIPSRALTRWLWALLLLLGHGSGAHAADKVLQANQVRQQPTSLTDYFSLLEDPGAQLTLPACRGMDLQETLSTSCFLIPFIIHMAQQNGIRFRKRILRPWRLL